jgi:hypothetical protein
MNPQRTRCSTKARIKKSKKDLETKHQNRSSSISLKDFSPKIWNGRGKRCVREWEVFLRLGMKFCACSPVRKSVGGVYKGSPKSWWPLGKSDWKTVEPVLKPVEPDSTKGFSVHWRTQLETRSVQIRLNRFLKLLHRFWENRSETRVKWKF